MQMDLQTESPALPSDLVTLKQAARLANNTHFNTIRRWINKGRLRGYRIGAGRTYYVSKADVMRMIYQVPIEPNPIKGVGPSKTEIDRLDKLQTAYLKANGIG